MTDIKRENNTVKFEMVLKAEEVKVAEDTVLRKIESISKFLVSEREKYQEK